MNQGYQPTCFDLDMIAWEGREVEHNVGIHIIQE